nr:hypothetical protein CFP56_24267 [Quercus suber]
MPSTALKADAADLSGRPPYCRPDSRRLLTSESVLWMMIHLNAALDSGWRFFHMPEVMTVKTIATMHWPSRFSFPCTDEPSSFWSVMSKITLVAAVFQHMEACVFYVDMACGVYQATRTLTHQHPLSLYRWTCAF